MKRHSGGQTGYSAVSGKFYKQRNNAVCPQTHSRRVMTNKGYIKLVSWTLAFLISAAIWLFVIGLAVWVI